MLARKDKC